MPRHIAEGIPTTQGIDIADGITLNSVPIGGIKAKIGYLNTSATTGHISITGVGFRPKVLQFFCSGGTSYASWFVNCDGSADASGNQSVSIWTMKGYGQTKTDACVQIYNSLLVDQIRATLVSMDSDGFTLNFTANMVGSIIRWIALG